MPSINLSSPYKDNALTLINKVLAELGLPQSSSVVSPDATTTQVVSLMNGLGDDLARLPLWEDLRVEWTITTTTAAAYDLPEDWGVPLADTQWDRSGRWPLRGPRTPSEWQYLKSGFGVAAPRYRYRYFNRQFNLHPAPQAGLTLVMEYLSQGWVLAVGSNPSVADVRRRGIVADTNYSLIDDRVMVQGTKLRFLEAKGLESSKARKQFELMLEAAWSSSTGATAIPLDGGRDSFFLTDRNIPDTGYGP
jgi:hypothetical protein